jgi:L,D-transpeptidase ErfK/SrfK
MIRQALTTLGLCLLLAAPAAASTYVMDDPEAMVVGEIHIEYARRSDTLMDIARWLNMGYREIRRANPEVDLWIPGEGTRVLIPSMWVLPDAPRDGIVINRAEKRLYYFHSDPNNGQRLLTTHPIGIGRQGRETPIGSAHVIAKLDNPAWYPTQGVIDDYASRGMSLPRMIPPGPDNPLGEHAMVLDLPGYLIHGTHRPDGVGMRVSQGCVRLYPEHIRDLIHQVPIGTPVHFVDQPVKLGMRGGEIYLEIHADANGKAPNPETVWMVVDQWLSRNGPLPASAIEAGKIEMVMESADGVPRVISSRRQD